MAYTYNTFTNVTVGSVLQASDYNRVLENVNNYRVPPMVSAKITGTVNIANATPTAIAWGGADDYDTDGFHDPASNNTRLTLSVAGVWMVTAVVIIAANGAGQRFAFIRKNGSDTIAAQSQPAQSAFSFAAVVSALVDSNGTTDYVEVVVDQNSGSPLAVDAASRFQAHFVGQKS